MSEYPDALLFDIEGVLDVKSSGRDPRNTPLSGIEHRRAWIYHQGGCCAECGSMNSLEVDHIDPTLKTMQPTKIFARSTPVELRERELANCQVLCRSCHNKKTGRDNSRTRKGIKLNVRVRTHCKHGHEFSKENTYIAPSGSKVCRACRVSKHRA